MPDMEVSERPWTKYCDSLHRFLKDYMASDYKILDAFKEDESNAFYLCETSYPTDIHNSEWDMVFPTYAAVLKGIRVEEKRNDMEGFLIKKRWIGKNEYIVVRTMLDGEIVDYRTNTFGTDYEAGYGFDGMWIEIYTPFKKGDILLGSNPFTLGHSGFNREPFVLDSICYWNERNLNNLRKNADTSDMTAYGYWVNEDGQVYGECMHSYQKLEYYRGELTSSSRILTAISNHIKGEINCAELLQAYEVIRVKKQLADANHRLQSMDEYLHLFGLKPRSEN